MIDTTLLKSRLQQRIAQAERAKFKDRPAPAAECDHLYTDFKQTTIPSSEQFRGTDADFIVKACTNCQ